MAIVRRFAMSLIGQVRSCSCLTPAMLNSGRSLVHMSQSQLLWKPRHGLLQSVLSSSQEIYSAPFSTIRDQDVQIDDETKAKMENEATSAVLSRVNQSIAEATAGRLFAVVHVAGKQFKVTDGDLIVVQGHWPPTVGERLRLEKVLLVGSANFSLLGRPLLEQGMVSVEAIVVEKSLSHTRTIFRKKKRKNYKRINFCRMPLTTLRITSVRLEKTVDGET